MGFLAIFLLSVGCLTGASIGQSPVRWGRDIQPLLSDRCFACHGPDESARVAGLRLDERESATTEGAEGAAVAPGKPDASLLWKRINHEQRELRMPPASAKKKPFSAEELALIRRWIEEGASYEDHWAFTPPKRRTAPTGRFAASVKNAVDAHILAKLEKEGFAPSPAADPTRLVRRVFLDLTGLPPTPADVDRFLADTAPDAWERLVDRLLNEEPWRSRTAERLAVPWLDAARYADTCGLHTDAGRSIWPWRDWVLGAFRDNLPFDRFITDQIAGDLVPNATLAQKVATGFNRNHVTSDEGGAIIDELLVEYAVDRTATTGSVFLGLTVGCARCHDPVSQAEFYGLLAYFNSVEEPGLYSQTNDRTRAHEPFLSVPSARQESELAALRKDLDAARAILAEEPAEEIAGFNAFLHETASTLGVAWHAAAVTQAVSREGAEMTTRPDGSIAVSGKNPPKDVYTFTLDVAAGSSDAVLVELLPDPALPDGRVGRSPNGNAVLSSIRVDATPRGEASRPVSFDWAWADHAQQDGDFDVTNLLDDGGEGWAVDGHRRKEPRVALLIADAPFLPEAGGTLTVRLHWESRYASHAAGRIRLHAGRIPEAARKRLPTSAGTWIESKPYTGERSVLFDREDAPTSRPFPAVGDNADWARRPAFRDATVNALPGGVQNSYVARRLRVPSARTLRVGLGSDDGVRVTIAGREVHKNRIERGARPNDDTFSADVPAGDVSVLVKVVNTGGEGGFWWKHTDPDDVLVGDLVSVLLPPDVRASARGASLRKAWRERFSPTWTERNRRVTELETSIATLESKIPRTMVMKERPEPVPTFVLDRGAYDKPNKQRPVTRGIPRALGTLPPDAPADRRGLARWLVDPSNPLVARVAVNRVWEWIFGQGLVRTSEDFGLQGEFPSHPELLDDLAVRFREGGWDLRALIREIVVSSTYRQESRRREDVAAKDPENRWLAWYPRRRLEAETLRDAALSASGLLVESFGGPPVFPEQPPGLWEEVAMLVSNTRFQPTPEGDDRFRRSLYTFWKRASPPPAMMALDAPTRESCVVRRLSTNTPLQALALWNEAQFVEAARGLARIGKDAARDDMGRLRAMFRRAVGRLPAIDEESRLLKLLAESKTRFAADAGAARALTKVDNDAAATELAPLVLLANTLFNLDAFMTRS